MSGIFISYRREDSADVTGRIHDRLAQHFGQDRIFTDVDSIPLGVNFARYIDDQVGKCQILLAVVGRDWLSGTDEQGQPRLQSSDDFVRLEIESALRRDIPVIPLLVRGASIPKAEDLPETLAELALRNGTLIRPNPDFHRDMDRLVKGIEHHLEQHARAEAQRKAGEEQRQKAADEVERKATHDARSARLKKELMRLRADAANSDLAGLRALESEVETLIAEFPNAPPLEQLRDQLRAAVKIKAQSDTASTSVGESRKSSKTGKDIIFISLALALVAGIGVYVAVQSPAPTVTPDTTAGTSESLVIDESVTIESAAPEPSIAETVTAFAAGDVFRDSLKDGSKGPAMVVIPAGNFLMGSAADEEGRYDSESPQHEVKFDQPFAIGRYEVTFDEYDLFAAATGRDKPGDQGWGRGDRPVINVNWEDAVTYAQWLSERTGLSYHLPSEAEWEYAARANTTTIRYWTENAEGEKDAACTYANVFDAKNESPLKRTYTFITWGPFDCADEFPFTAPVGKFAANDWALHDMLGNVQEWVQDCYVDTYAGAPADGSPEEMTDGSECALRVLRGGSWYLVPRLVRSAGRLRFTPDFRGINIGFRLARTL